MQALENNVVSLRSVDGGLSRLALDVSAGREAIADSDLESVLCGLSRVLGAVAPGVRLGDPRPEGSGFGAWLGIAQPHAAPLCVRRVRALAPAVAARDRHLDLVVVSSPRVDGAPAGGVPLDAAAQLAARLGCERVAIATYAGEGSGVVSSREPDVECVDIDAMLYALASGESVADMLVVPADRAASVVAVASGLAGTGALTTAHEFSAGALRSTAGAPLSGALPTLPGLLLALAELLVLSGRVERGRLVADALCRTLEDGIHTPDLAVTHPYARLADDAAFADAVIERLGEPVRSVRAHFARLPGRRGAPGRPAMRLVRGGVRAS